MQMMTETPRTVPDLDEPKRNHYFYGMLLDVYNFRLETDYQNSKRWLLNRLVTGYGVVCGLSVDPGPDSSHVSLTKGVAIDKWGREIIVSDDSPSIAIPPDVLNAAMNDTTDSDGQGFLQVWICYKECLGDPVPVLAGSCGSTDPCAPSAVRERYELKFLPGRAPVIEFEGCIEGIVSNGRLNYPALANYVTGGCPEVPDDPCIPLANICLQTSGGHDCSPESFDISVRPLVYSNDMLLQIATALAMRRK